MIPLHEPSLSGKERRYVLECVDSGWISSASPFVGRFERAVADYVGAPHAAAVASGSAALHLALQLADVRPDDEVLISDLTFVAPVHTILQCGAHPVLIDADDSWQLDAGAVAEFLAAECASARARRSTAAPGVACARSSPFICSVLPAQSIAFGRSRAVIGWR